MSEVNVSVEADAFEGAMRDLERSADRFASAMVDALKGATVEGRELDDVLRSLAKRLADIALQAALKPLEKGLGDFVSGLASGLGGAAGGAGIGAGAFPDAPPMPGGAAGFAPAAAAPITFNVTTPDAESFQRSSGQIAAMVARSAARGRRSL